MAALAFAHGLLGLFEGAGADAEHGAHDCRGGDEIAPVGEAASGIIGDVRAGVENHAEGEGGLRRPRRIEVRLGPLPPAFLRSWFKIN